MKKNIVCFCLLASIAVFSSVSHAETAVNAVLSVEDALRMAYLHHPRMKEAREEISASKGRWLQAEAFPDPEMEFDIGGLKKGEDDSRKGNLDSFAVKQPLDPLGTRFLRGRIAWDDVTIAKSGLNLVWGKIRSEVIEMYYRILAEEKALDVARDNLNVTRQFFTKVEINYQSGSALQSDVLRAKIEVSKAESEFLIAEKNLRVAVGNLNIALGREVTAPLELGGAMSYETLHYTYEQIKEQAFEKRADLKAETIRLKQKKKGFWQSLLKTFFPQMAIGIERTTEDYENDTAFIVEASYPLWGFNLGEVKEAKAEKEIQSIRLESLKKQVGFEVYQAFLETELAEKQVMIQQKALEQANELLRQVAVSYGEGEVPFLTYLENLKTIKETRLGSYKALLNYKKRLAELERFIQATPVPEGIQL